MVRKYVVRIQPNVVGDKKRGKVNIFMKNVYCVKMTSGPVERNFGARLWYTNAEMTC